MSSSVGLYTSWPFFKRLKLTVFFNFIRGFLGFAKLVFKLIGPRRPQANKTEYYTSTNGRRLRVDIFEPEGARLSGLPILIHSHGSGFCVNTFRSDNNLCRALANAAQSVVLSIDYSKAPEYPWPAALEDLEHSIQWAKDQAPRRCWDAKRVALSGSSSGGSLALCASSSRPSGQDLKAVIALYPIVDFAEDVDKKPFELIIPKPEAGVNVSNWYAKLLFDAYLPPNVDRKNPRVSAAFAPLQNFPPATLILPEHDWTRREGEHFAARLRDVTDVAIFMAEGQSHGFDMTAKPGTRSQQVMDDAVAFIAKRLKRAYAS